MRQPPQPAGAHLRPGPVGVRLPRPEACESCGTPASELADPVMPGLRWSRLHEGWLCRHCYESRSGRILGE